MKQKEFTIRGAIQRDNRKIIAIIVAIVTLTMGSLGLIDLFQILENNARSQSEKAKNIIISQYAWLDDLMAGINNAGVVEVEMDYQKCNFAKWYSNLGSLKDTNANKLLTTAYSAHEQMHLEGKIVVDAAISKDTVQQGIAYGEMKSQSVTLLTALNDLAGFYNAKAEKHHSNLVGFIIFAIVANFLCAIIASILAKRFGDKMALKISNPIESIASWSHELSIGSSDLSFDSKNGDNDDLVEINRMVNSFRTMADNIQENVNVVQKVADGDMTAFVNIRSASDSLGKNLYRMVQSNDIMFAEISHIAQCVAEGSENIAHASSSLAESCTLQSGAVKDFTTTIQETSLFIRENNEKASSAIDVSAEIKEEVKVSSDKMSQLLTSMTEIREASEKVSDIIKSIDNIANQTNLLALNAAIEAARAGEAGKGFVVVAEEVKDLAAKSAEAAKESRELINDTVQKTIFGDTVSKDTSETFSKITESIDRILSIIEDIAKSGSNQQNHIKETEQTIMVIADAIDGNAAASEEAAAASAELTDNASELKDAMQRFHLRKREPGKPYIPPEKKNDSEFIKKAQENYNKALKEGKVHKN